MKISFFRNGYIVLNRDYSYTRPVTVDGITTDPIGHPDCIFCKDLEFNEDTQTISFNPDTEEIIIEDKPIPVITETVKNIGIGDKITQDVFGGNPYAQLADMVKAQVITLALLVPVLGKETVKAAYADLLVTVQKVSESRVSQGLEPYDLSFLD